MKENLSRREFLNIAFLGSVALLIGCRSTENNAGLTQVDIERMQRENFEIIKNAKTGEVITIPNYVLHGFEDVSVNTVPLIGGLIGEVATERFAYAMRRDTQNSTRYSSLIMGAGCLLTDSEKKGLLSHKNDKESKSIDGKTKFMPVSRPLVLKQVTVVVGPTILNSEDAKLLQLLSYTADEQTQETKCVPDETNPENIIKLAGAALLAEWVRP